MAAAAGGVVYGVELTLDDENWRGRGGYPSMVTVCLMFFAYLLPLTALAAFMLARGLAPLRSAAFALLAILLGALLVGGGFGLVMIAMGSGPYPLADSVPAAIAGAVLGALLTLMRSPPQRSANNG